MKYQHIKWVFKGLYYAKFKKHYCPKCNELLNPITVSRIVNWEEPDAKNFNFHTLDNYMIGNVKFIWTELKCPKCGGQISVEEMKRMEQSKNDEK